MGLWGEGFWDKGLWDEELFKFLRAKNEIISLLVVILKPYCNVVLLSSVDSVIPSQYFV